MRVLNLIKPTNFILFILVLIQITNLKINFFPRNLILLSFFVGSFLLITKLIKETRINKDFFYGGLLLIFPLIFLLISMLINQYMDFDFFKEIILFNLIIYISAYGLILLNNKYDKNRFFILLISCGVAFQLVISFILFLVPSAFVFASNLFELTQDADKAIDLNAFRMVGIGAGFFQSGILNSFVLVMLAGAIISGNFKNKEKNLLFILMLLISVLGLFSSRSTIIGIIVSFLLLMINIYKSRSLIYSIIIIFIITIFAIPFINILSGNSRLLDLFDFGTQFIFDFNNSQASQSTGELNDMWQIWPNSIKTWLFGDVKYRDGEMYYMHTDVGYARFVYSVGFFGMLSILIGQIYLIVKLDKSYFNFQTKICLIIVLLICEVKGVTLFTPFLSLLYLASIYSNKK